MGKAQREGTKAIERMLRSPENYTLNQMIEWYQDARKKNKKLRETLGFYADKKNYHKEQVRPEPSAIEKDEGQKARQVLGDGE